MRTVFLGGLDDRIRCTIAVGFMTTGRVSPRQVFYAHLDDLRPTIAAQPGFPRDPGTPTLPPPWCRTAGGSALHAAEMKRADAMIRETFERAGENEKYRCLFYSGGHKFDREMQKDAFEWFDRYLLNR